MLNIIIKDSDVLFQYGLQVILADLFQHGFREQVQFTNQFTYDSVSVADIIVLSLCAGEMFTCIPVLRSRKKSIVIGLIDDEFRNKTTLSCLSGIILISRRASLATVRENLFIAWYKTMQPGYLWNQNSCLDCHHKKLSSQQIRIMMELNKGLSFTQIAQVLNISEKTVFTHKYMIMQKFDIRNDYELISLLHRLAENSSA